MKIEEKDFVWIAIAAVVLLIASMWFNVRYAFSGQSDSEYRDSVRVTVYDTVAIYKPAPTDSSVIGHVNARLPIRKPKVEELNTPMLNDSTPDNKGDNFLIKDHSEDMGGMVLSNIVNIGNDCDSADVIVPITQKMYGDSTYTAYVSGYQPSLDSLIFRMPKEVVTIKEYSKPKRWSVNVRAGYEIPLHGTMHPTPYIDLNVQYNLFSF